MYNQRLAVSKCVVFHNTRTEVIEVDYVSRSVTSMSSTPKATRENATWFGSQHHSCAFINFTTYIILLTFLQATNHYHNHTYYHQLPRQRQEVPNIWNEKELAHCDFEPPQKEDDPNQDIWDKEASIERSARTSKKQSKSTHHNTRS